ncbi:hypothetical protein [Streptomyces formicae]|uniref:Uncharacterized protein n=1 Tax=Streptomyces formicae TaxID=1616117 RepID=A0ABY3WKY4_9ACTN|nr:hypothetical protein [Streptomyces formicae]UNM12345.1 hypothetical protein J4032_13070 [Streptomyces formicae]
MSAMDKRREDMIVARARELYRADRARHAKPRRPWWRRALDRVRNTLGGE